MKRGESEARSLVCEDRRRKESKRDEERRVGSSKAWFAKIGGERRASEMNSGESEARSLVCDTWRRKKSK